MIDAAEMAKQLILAEQEHRAIAPFTHLNPELDTDTAYAAQRIVVQTRLDNGERIVGAKLGLTSRVKQKAMGGCEGPNLHLLHSTMSRSSTYNRTPFHVRGTRRGSKQGPIRLGFVSVTHLSRQETSSLQR
jgi:2-keto-4-pentenoate hydratase